MSSSEPSLVRSLRAPLSLLILVALWSAMLPTQQAAYGQSDANIPIRLRRATIDTSNTLQWPVLSATPVDANQSLLLVQFDSPPTQQNKADLEAAGLKVLLDIPEQALLVRATPGMQLPSALPGLRWIGAYSPAYRLTDELETALQKATDLLDIRLVATPDADLADLRATLQAQGATVLSEYTGLTGTSMHVQLQAERLSSLIKRPDIVWAERYQMPKFTNDSASGILGVDTARSQYGLDGAGQIIAITDSGLDSQTSLSADFSGRLVRGFGNREMGYSSEPSKCTQDNWSDRHGHGTHVSGTALGSGVLSSGKFAGMAPAAGIVIQSVSTGGSSLNCLPDDAGFLQKAYDAGARIQNGSYGGETTGDPNKNGFGAYTQEAAYVDDFLWKHPDHLFVVAAGNNGKDFNIDGVIESDSIGTPGTAKNVLTVGASENEHIPSTQSCSTSVPEQLCWISFGFVLPTSLANDLTSNNRNGMAAWSSRGPTDDGRIKPEIVAPGTTIISARSHDSAAHYPFLYNANYAYDWGTSMATPAISGMAALVRQWLSRDRGLTNPSAALVKAMLLNGAIDMSPGQYGTGTTREIPAAWPNNTQGWGRAYLPDSLDLANQHTLWFTENSGLSSGELVEYRLNVAAGQPLRLTLSWTDYPGTPTAAKALVNNLDLELLLPDGISLLRGNSNAPLPSSCRSSAGADSCNTTESILISSPVAGEYRVRVRASSISVQAGKQPFALVMRAAHVDVVTLAAPVLAEPGARSASSLWLKWSAVTGADFYKLERSQDTAFSSFATFTTALTNTSVIQEQGTSYYRVRACYSGGCGAPSNVRSYTTLVAPGRSFMPIISFKR